MKNSHEDGNFYVKNRNKKNTGIKQNIEEGIFIRRNFRSVSIFGIRFARLQKTLKRLILKGN